MRPAPASAASSGPPAPARAGACWDVFCRVIDNHGDLGVCWRLCRQLAARGVAVRLWCDDAAALAWMAPQGAPGVTLLPWRDPLPHEQPGDVVVEAFGCDPPAAFVARMAAAAPPPVWVNLEYLSAEDYVERSHGLPSPQLAGPGRGLVKWFYYPGFTPATGGLLRESGIAGVPAPGAPAARARVSVFAYHADALPALLQALPAGAVDLALCPGPARDAAARAAADAARARPGSVATPLPWLTQDGYDALLQSCDLNLVRGEDSFVRAQWAARPFLWQIYPQDDGAHVAKLEAFLDHFLAGADTALAHGVRHWHRRWNGLDADAPAGGLPPLAAWQAHCLRWRNTLLQQPDLVTALLGFVAARR